MSRYIEPPPRLIDPNAILRWLTSVYDAFTVLENLVVTTVTANKTLLSEDSGLVLLANTGAITVTLPGAAIAGAGCRFLFIKTTVDAQAVTLDGYSAETINGGATNAQIDAQYDRIGIVSDGSQWLIYEREIS